MLATLDNVSSTPQFRDRLAGDDLRELCPAPRLIIDGGAGSGGFARNARATWPNSRIISFEPHSRFNKVLQPLDANHEIRRKALGAYNGQVKLFTTHGPESNSVLEFLGEGPLEKIHQVVGHEYVGQYTLDATCAADGPVDLLKLDVQGAELRVLEGAKGILQKHSPVLYVEVALQAQYQHQPLLSDVDFYLKQLGYRRLYLYASPMPDVWADAIYVPEKHWTHSSHETRPVVPIRLNIGAGETVIDGFTPIDLKFGTAAYPLPQYADGSVEEIRCSHMFEHLSYREGFEALKEWHRVLRPGGRLRISVPDVEKVIPLVGKTDMWRFYLMGGQEDAHDFHRSCWTTELLTQALTQEGFTGIQPWESPNTDTAALPISLNLEGFKEVAGAPEETAAITEPAETIPEVKVRAVVGVPRIGWNDAWQSIIEALQVFDIPLEQLQGCFWGQNMQRALERALKDGIDWVITLDYDSMILPMHVSRLMEILGTRPDVDAVAALQMRRGAETPLFGTGRREQEFLGFQPIKVDTAHFGLTAIRVECLKDLPKPWLIDVPDKDGGYGGDHRDADITFWDKWKAAGKSLYIAPDVRIGHLELLVSEYDDELKPRHFHAGDWWNRHAKAGHCMRTSRKAN